MNQDIDGYDYQRFAILFVDDEATTRKYFRRLFAEKFRILEAEDGVQALEVFRANAEDIAIVVTDQRMPNETGVGFLSKIAGDYPDVIKILSTAYTDIDAAIGSVNKGGIFRYITKPWDIPQLEVTLRRAMEFYAVKRERDALLGAKLQAMGNVLVSCRLAAFALAPVCAGIKCDRAAEAIAGFIKAGVSGKHGDSDGDLVSPDLKKLHEGQLLLASALEKQLPGALHGSFNERVDALAKSLAAASGGSVAQAATETGVRITSSEDPLPRLVDALLSRNQSASTATAAVQVLAAVMSVYDAGGLIRRVRGDGMVLDVTAGGTASKESSPGTATAKWLMDDDLLISAALGLI